MLEREGVVPCFEPNQVPLAAAPQANHPLASAFLVLCAAPSLQPDRGADLLVKGGAVESDIGVPRGILRRGQRQARRGEGEQ